MEKSTGNIEFDAYVGYLKKVTEEPTDLSTLKNSVLKIAVENTEMQNALSLLKRLVLAVMIVLVCAIGMAWFGMSSYGLDGAASENIWYSARMQDNKADGAVRLYNAYGHSKGIHEIL